MGISPSNLSLPYSQQKQMRTLLITLMLSIGVSHAVCAQSHDEVLKRKIVGYWASKRHAYHFVLKDAVHPDNIGYFVVSDDPNDPNAGSFTWDVKNGVFYERGESQGKITVLDSHHFNCAEGDDLVRITKAETKNYY
jgi:hypothetical protein